MPIMIKHSVKRLFREGKKSLSVPLIALVLVILINLLGGIKSWLEEQYEDIIENFPITAVISDLTGENTDDLHIDMRYINIFTDPDVHFSLSEHTERIMMRRVINDYTTVIPGEFVTLEAELTVIGTVSGIEHGMIFSPFWTVSSLAEDLTDIPPYTESLSVILNNNRELDDFIETAKMSFSRTNPVADSRPFAMTIYDMEFYETLEPLRQNIIVVDVATPFIFILSIAVGFLTSVLLTRRRKAEFAIMRSIGVSKRVVFSGALAEQALLSITGATLGFVFTAAVWGYTSLTRPAIFLACYLLGAFFAATGAAGTKDFNRDKFRLEHVSVIYQSLNLFPLLTAIENVMFPLEYKGISKSKAKKIAVDKLESVGIDKTKHRRLPSMLSGGEQQRVAIARALASKSEVILADEPTGNLDSENSLNIVQLLKDLAVSENVCVIVVTHDPAVAERADAVVKLSDGKIVD